MTDFLISPAERSHHIKALGRNSAVPEQHGADILWWDDTIKGFVGVQRKAVPDLVASVGDGRLAKEVAQLMTVKVAVLIIEGRPRWTTDGHLSASYTRWSRTAHRSLVRSIQGRGIFVEMSDSTADTAKLIIEIAAWVHKGDHTSLDRRPNPNPNPWGVVNDEAWGCHLLQSVPGIGPKQAKAIWDHFDGKLPIGLTVSREELLKVKGLGKGKADQLMKSFGSLASVTPSM